ncbi:hypothetical protein P4S72_27645 [Vibrio sp. PP-XX7]
MRYLATPVVWKRSQVWSLIEPIMIKTLLVEGAGQIVAVAVRRPFGRGQVIGPVVALLRRWPVS